MLGFLSYPDLGRVRLVSRRLRTLASDAALYDVVDWDHPLRPARVSQADARAWLDEVRGAGVAEACLLGGCAECVSVRFSFCR